MFHAPERYVVMFGYERAMDYPMGHRNVIQGDGQSYVALGPPLADMELAGTGGCPLAGLGAQRDRWGASSL